MPADPLLNEQLLLTHLRDRTRPITPEMMRSMCGLVLLGCYDRKVTREFMAEMINAVIAIEAVLVDMEVGAMMRKFLLDMDPERDPVHLDAALDDLVKVFSVLRRNLSDKFDLTAQCPTTTDPIS